MTTKIEQLHDKLVIIAKKHAAEINDLSYRGSRGGSNARNIDGWSRSTANITRAGGLPMMDWWDGSNPTPSTGIPTCCTDEAHLAAKEVFWGMGQKKYGATEAEKMILRRIKFYRDEKIPQLSFAKIAKELNKDCRTKHGTKWTDVTIFQRYENLKEAK